MFDSKVSIDLQIPRAFFEKMCYTENIKSYYVEYNI